MIKQFCKDVLKFLKSEYSDSYTFEIELTEQRYSCVAELKIKTQGFTRIIHSSYLNYFFELYRHQDYIEERKQFKW
jgi:hypothetical protein